MKLSDLSETLIGSEIVKLGGEIREKIRQGQRIYNFTVGDFDPLFFPIPKELENEIVEAYREHFTNYPAAEGNLDLREAITSFIKRWKVWIMAPMKFLLLQAAAR
jgi:aspartate aminotransferase